VEQKDDPSQEDVDEVHAQFVAALKALFDGHKHMMPGWESKQLTIV
jgi:2-acylglycerol O-acyltransferase 2